jgi:membrane associated rhomboid family serine protease
MIPLHDENPTHSTPVFTVTLIAINVLVYINTLAVPGQIASIYDNYALVPAQLIHSPVSNYPNIFSSMFLHAGFMHLAGNMLYLWIFGNNIEDVLGKVKFILFYLLCGALAAIGHIATDFNSQIPMVGASGAISGILGAYLVLYPFAKVKTLVFLGIMVTVIRIPAIILLGLWIGLQIWSGMATSAEGGGVAWFAHIGGFLAGMILIKPFKALLKR